MLNEKKISVAIATYNGEKYLEKQLLSICGQSVLPDEIVISDDGSSDQTLEITNRLKEKYKTIDFVILTDNPRHGSAGNFEWAIKHTTGDYIFLSDQDDIWKKEKIKTVMRVFTEYPSLLMVVHEAKLIDKNDSPIEGVFCKWSNSILNSGKLVREKYLNSSLQFTINGMVMAFSRKLLSEAIPFPRCSGGHDTWLMFCAVCMDGAWYLKEDLCLYRLHGENTCGNSVYRGSWKDRIKKIPKYFDINGITSFQNQFLLGLSQEKLLEKYQLEKTDAMRCAHRISEVGEKQFEAMTSGRFLGGLKLIKLYVTDIRYRKSGTTAFIFELGRILFNSKKARCKICGQK